MPDEKATILVVDDQERNREICQENLEMEDYRILLAENGLQGVEKAGIEKPDLILLDIMMPELNGYEVLEQLQADEQLHDIPVLMLTAKASTPDVVRALSLGANDYLKKPFDIDELVARVDTLVRLKKAEDRLKRSVTKMEHQAALGIQAAGAAHDLSNVLGVLTYHQLIESCMEEIKLAMTHEQKERLSENFQLIEDGCEQIGETVKLGSELCRSMTGFAASADMGQRVQPVAPLISLPLQMYKRKLLSKRIEVGKELDENVSARCDSGQIHRIMLNLISNAMYALEKKDISDRKLDIHLQGNNGEVLLTVSDNGEGIGDDVLPHIFDYLYTTKNNHGSGIGLNTVKKIMDAHQGWIDVKSRPGKGTVFVLAFPEPGKQ